MNAPADEALGGEQVAALRRMLAGLGLAGEPRLARLTGGANNQVFLAQAGETTTLLKVYFRHPGDPRDRLGAEFSFCSFARAQGVRAVPRPLACDCDGGMALYEFIVGTPLRPGEVSAQVVQEALDFYLALNRERSAAECLPCASEACFSTVEHVECLQRRLQRLEGVPDAEVVDFVRGELQPAAGQVIAAAQERFGEAVVAAQDRRVSPSDFGFHNALREAGGALRFFDFEYAGWDDPAKVVCDFFCQPAVPVPFEHWDRFAAAVAADLAEPETQLARFRALLPLYRLKWCCILLNDFLPEGQARRGFAGGAAAATERQVAQLRKAREALAMVKEGLA